jgi:hypothetical protein
MMGLSLPVEYLSYFHSLSLDFHVRVLSLISNLHGFG